MTKTKKDIKHPCAVCKKNVSKCSKALYCSGQCSTWTHFKCSSLTLHEYNDLKTSKNKWFCDGCLQLIDKQLNCEESVNKTTEEINVELITEVNNLNETINMVYTDLIESNKKVKDLTSQVTCLERLLLEREEEILKLKDIIKNGSGSKLNQFKTVSYKNSAHHKRNDPIHFNLPLSNSFTALADENITPSQPEFNFSRRLSNHNTTQSSSKLRVHCSKTLKKQQSGVLHTLITQRKLPVQNDTDARSKLIIVADSHGRDLCHEIEQRTPNLDITAFVRPGALLSGVTHDIQEVTKHLTKADAVVVIGGTNDLEKRNSSVTADSICATQNFTSHTNLIFATIPMRHDNPELDDRLASLNDSITYQMKACKHGDVLPLHSLPRDYYTNHGLHFNRRGKRKIAEMIAEQLRLLHRGDDLHLTTPHPYSTEDHEPHQHQLSAPLHTRDQTVGHSVVDLNTVEHSTPKVTRPLNSSLIQINSQM